MSDTLALLALMNKGGSGEGITEEQVNQLIDNKNLQPKLTAGENITISNDNVISATDTGLTQEQVNTLIDSKNLQPKLTAGTNITIDGNNVISSVDTGVSEQQVNTLIDNKNLQPKLTAGENITISADNVISATASGGGSSYTSLKEQNIEGSQPGLIVTNQEDLSKFEVKNGGVIIGKSTASSTAGFKLDGPGLLICNRTDTYNANTTVQGPSIALVDRSSNGDMENINIGDGSLVVFRANGGTSYSSIDDAFAFVMSDYGSVSANNQSIIVGSAGNSSKISSSTCSIAVGKADSTFGNLGQSTYSIECTQAFGTGVQAGSSNQMVIGKSNVIDENSKYVFIIGNGESKSARSNALTVDWAGNLVCNNIPAAPTADGNYVLKCSIVGGVPTYSWVAEQ